MKNKILKFIELVREAHEDDEQELRDITLDLSDELINFEIHKGYFSKQAIEREQHGEKIFLLLHDKAVYPDDKYCFCIEIKLNQLENMSILGKKFGNRLLIYDKKIFTIFKELYNISERYENCFLHINTGLSVYNPAIYLFILIDTEVDPSDTKISQIFKEIKSRNSTAKSDFSHDTTVYLQDNKIVISSNLYSYTDRKFKGLIRGIDLNDFTIEKTESDGRIKNIISKK